MPNTQSGNRSSSDVLKGETLKLRLLRALLALNSCALILAFAWASERQAYAYGDPGSGLLILQGIGSAVMGVLFVCRRRLGKLFYRSKQAHEIDPDTNPGTNKDTEPTHE